jgi:hypothetical protein
MLLRSSPLLSGGSLRPPGRPRTHRKPSPGERCGGPATVCPSRGLRRLGLALQASSTNRTKKLWPKVERFRPELPGNGGDCKGREREAASPGCAQLQEMVHVVAVRHGPRSPAVYGIIQHTPARDGVYLVVRKLSNAATRMGRRRENGSTKSKTALSSGRRPQGAG